MKEFDFPPSIPGGKAEFRRSLTLSFLFKFNLEVLQSLRKMVTTCLIRDLVYVVEVSNKCFLQNAIENIVVENMEPLPREIQPSQQQFQVCLGDMTQKIVPLLLERLSSVSTM